jgi:hypothetical protein
MDPMEAERLLRKLDRRLEQVEQILPTLASRAEMKDAIAEAVEPLVTKEYLHAELAAAIAPLATKAELAAAIAPLATKAELAAAIAPLATRDEMRAEGVRTRQHFDVVAESLRDDIRLLAEHQVAFQADVNRGFKDVGGRLNNHEKRIARLEAGAAKGKRSRR